MALGGLNEGLLDGMQAAAIGQSLDRDDLTSLALDHQRRQPIIRLPLIGTVQVPHAPSKPF